MKRARTLCGLLLLAALFPTGPSAQVVAPKAVPLPTLPVGSVVSGVLGAAASRAELTPSPAHAGLILPASLLAPIPSAAPSAFILPSALPSRSHPQAAPAPAPVSERRSAESKSVPGFPEGPSATADPKEGDFSSSELAEALRKSVDAATPEQTGKDEEKGGERAGRRLDRMFDGAGERARGEETPVSVPSQRPAYLKEVEGLSGQDLFWALHEIEKKGHHAHDYREASAFIFGTADNVTMRGVRGVVDAYSGIFVPGTSDSGGRYGEPGDQNGDGYADTSMNIEHVWPQSFFNKRLPMKSDVHHLMATFNHPNSIRGHLPFGEVRGGATYENKGGAKSDGSVFEPPDFTKGRVARALLYFFVRYCDEEIMAGDSAHFWGARLEMLLRWNREHPPTDFERRRNDLVERYQGNRNPFIDDPSLAERIGMEALRKPGRRASESVSRRAPEGVPSGWADAQGLAAAPAEPSAHEPGRVRSEARPQAEPRVDQGPHSRHGKRWNKRHHGRR